MGIIDDYYGGYENIAAWTNEDGETDFDGAYEAASGSLVVRLVKHAHLLEMIILPNINNL